MRRTALLPVHPLAAVAAGLFVLAACGGRPASPTGDSGATPRPNASVGEAGDGAEFVTNACAVGPSYLESGGHKSLTGRPLAPCAPATGFHRDGYCRTSDDDRGAHVVCAEVTAEFLAFTAARGNDLQTPGPNFPGLKPGDRWCLCGARWAEARAVAPPVILEATDEAALRYAPRVTLESHGK